MWFITPEDQILNSYTMSKFWTEKRDVFYVYCSDGRDQTFLIARFLTGEETRNYLNNLFIQLQKN